MRGLGLVLVYDEEVLVDLCLARNLVSLFSPPSPLPLTRPMGRHNDDVPWVKAKKENREGAASQYPDGM